MSDLDTARDEKTTPDRAKAGSDSLLVVTVNYRTASLMIDCLRSLREEVRSLPGTRVVVAENASGDDSVTRLEAAIRENGWQDWASLHPLERNGGFASGNNAVIRPALRAANPPRYVLLLNPDTIVRPGALSALVEFMDARPDVGLAGSRLEEPDGTPQRSAFRFPSILGELEGGMRFGPISRLLANWAGAPPVPEERCPVDWVAGASLIVRRAVFETIGLLDEGYFLYFEEVDFCLRARRAGWPCWYVPESRVVHLVGQSSGVTDPRRCNRRLPAYWFQSRRRYYLANHGPVTMFLANLAWASAFATYRVRQVLQRKPDRDPDRMLRDFLRHNFFLGAKP